MALTPTQQLTWAQLDEIVEAGAWFRGSHLLTCHVCGKLAGKHTHMLHPDTGHTLWLRLCEPRPGTKLQYIKP